MCRGEYLTLHSMEGYQCQKSTLCNKCSNKKECGINKKERGILQALARLSIRRKADRTLVYQSRYVQT